jgi:hypothetical protein
MEIHGHGGRQVSAIEVVDFCEKMLNIEPLNLMTLRSPAIRAAKLQRSVVHSHFQNYPQIRPRGGLLASQWTQLFCVF